MSTLSEVHSLIIEYGLDTQHLGLLGEAVQELKTELDSREHFSPTDLDSDTEIHFKSALAFLELASCELKKAHQKHKCEE